MPKGIRISDVKVGTGAVAKKGFWALIRYNCYLPQGECVKSEPAYFRVGWRDTYHALDYGVIGMAVGGIRQVKVSPNITYYERNLNPAIPDNAALRYELELLEVTDRYIRQTTESI